MVADAVWDAVADVNCLTYARAIVSSVFMVEVAVWGNAVCGGHEQCLPTGISD